ncbi:MAG: arylesterase [Hyphomicrobiaceae bacterium]
MSLPANADSTGPIKIVAFGDSLTAGYLLPADKGFAPVLARVLKSRGHDVEIINAGVSGDTTAAGLERLAWAVPPNADAVIVELGANDALRGLSPQAARNNLDKILATLKAQKSDILISGMRAPRSLGDNYVNAFDPIFADLAQKYGAILHPFFLERIALKANLNLSDGIHPNEKGVEEIVADILPKVEELIARVKARRIIAKNG